MKLVKCSYQLQPDERLGKAIGRIVTSSKNFPFQTFGKNGWLRVTERLNGKGFKTEALFPGDQIALLVPEEQIQTDGGSQHLSNCLDVYYLVESAVRPYPYNVENVTRKIRGTKGISNADIVADFKDMQKLLPLTSINERWYFLMRFRRGGADAGSAEPEEEIANVPHFLPPTTPEPLKNEFPNIPSFIAPEFTPKPPPAKKPKPPEPKYEPITVKELTQEKIAALPPEKLKKIDPVVVEKKASETSFMDSLKPGMDTLFAGMNKKTPSGVIGFRIGYPLVAGNTLPAKIKTIGFLIERRGDFLKGLRYAYDFSPLSKADNLGVEESISYARHSLGWAFEIPMNYFFNQIHLIPRLGSYKVNSEFAVVLNDGTVQKQSFTIKNGLAIGWEADIEKAAYFWILRAWVAQDVSGKTLGLKNGASVSSLKTGLDASIKGSGFNMFGTPISANYTAFIARDSINLSAANATNENFVVIFEVPMAGLGLALSW